MSRLSSFRGPSTPTSSPVQQKQAPSSPSRSTECTYHRRTRTLLQELRAVAQTWDELVLIDGLKAARSLVDARTDLDNALTVAGNAPPRTRIVGPKLALMEKNISELDLVIQKLQRQFKKMNQIVDSLESVLFEACASKGWQWCHETPLWVTWTLEMFVSKIPTILPVYHRSLDEHLRITQVLREHSVPFEKARSAIRQWTSQNWLEEDGWDANWEDLCAVEIERWQQR